MTAPGSGRTAWRRCDAAPPVLAYCVPEEEMNWSFQCWSARVDGCPGCCPNPEDRFQQWPSSLGGQDSAWGCPLRELAASPWVCTLVLWSLWEPWSAGPGACARGGLVHRGFRQPRAACTFLKSQPAERNDFTVVDLGARRLPPAFLPRLRPHASFLRDCL